MLIVTATTLKYSRWFLLVTSRIRLTNRPGCIAGPTAAWSVAISKAVQPSQSARKSKGRSMGKLQLVPEGQGHSIAGAQRRPD
jgi:hypothetical protein